jgi:phosphatidylglycerol---prolipoprotein diacylglyceryl transferase
MLIFKCLIQYLAMLDYIIWNPEQTIFRIGALQVRWYGLCVLLAFLGGRQIIRYTYDKENRPREDADNFSTWVLCTALFGARLGEIFFYDFGYYLRHPIETFLPVTFDPHFKFTGYAGLSYHGAIVGSLLGTYLYANYRAKLQFSPFLLKIKKQKREGQHFLWLSTPLALAMMMGFLVRIGNFTNSEITGTPTHGRYGVLFAKDVTERLQQSSEAIVQVKVLKRNTPTAHRAYQPITLKITFRNVNFEEDTVRKFLEHHTKNYLTADKSISRHVYESPEQPLNYTLSKTRKKSYVAEIVTLGIPRHPVQLYEGIAYIITLVLHLYWWRQRRKTLKDGVIAGSAMITCYSLRFVGEFFKDPFNIVFDGFVTLTMGHLLSLLTVFGGIFLLIYINMPHKKRSIE